MAIKIEQLNYVYSPGNAYEKKALVNINLNINDGDFIGLIGHTGSGKSTLVQHLNGLIKATSGAIYYNDENIYNKDYNFRELRNKVGLVFQYPEHQLFETTVYKDVSFGPTNQGLSKEEVANRTKQALNMVGIQKELYEASPFELSGGQKRRAAIAGVLAMKPEVLILDEPTAGLDPKGRNEILEQIKKLHIDNNMTIILVSHSMEDVARYANRIVVMNKGSILYNAAPREVFFHYKELEEIGLAAPQVTYIMNELNRRGMNVNTTTTTIKEAKDEILHALRKGRLGATND
jgi:energy-coupling factor transport system ATP-binding protein